MLVKPIGLLVMACRYCASSSPLLRALEASDRPEVQLSRETLIEAVRVVCAVDAARGSTACVADDPASSFKARDGAREVLRILDWCREGRGPEGEQG